MRKLPIEVKKQHNKENNRRSYLAWRKRNPTKRVKRFKENHPWYFSLKAIRDRRGCSKSLNVPKGMDIPTTEEIMKIEYERRVDYNKRQRELYKLKHPNCKPHSTNKMKPIVILENRIGRLWGIGYEY